MHIKICCFQYNRKSFVVGHPVEGSRSSLCATARFLYHLLTWTKTMSTNFLMSTKKSLWSNNEVYEKGDTTVKFTNLIDYHYSSLSVFCKIFLTTLIKVVLLRYQAQVVLSPLTGLKIIYCWLLSPNFK